METLEQIHRCEWGKVWFKEDLSWQCENDLLKEIECSLCSENWKMSTQQVKLEWVEKRLQPYAKYSAWQGATCSRNGCNPWWSCGEMTAEGSLKKDWTNVKKSRDLTEWKLGKLNYSRDLKKNRVNLITALADLMRLTHFNFWYDETLLTVKNKLRKKKWGH